MGSCTADEGSAPAMEDLHPLLHTGGKPPLCSIDTQLGQRLHWFCPPHWYFHRFCSPSVIGGWGFFVGMLARDHADMTPYQKEVIYMARKQKSTALYKTPFSAGYWRDAAAELKDTKMLVFAAMIVVMRVALKTIIRIPLGPSLDITPAFMANALGAMVYGPVVGAIGAIVSDVLGVILRGDTYFVPYVLTEISGTIIFAMFFYRQKITPIRVILSRFSICLFVQCSCFLSRCW